MKPDNVNSPGHYQLNQVCYEVEDIIHDRLLAIYDNGWHPAFALRIARPYGNHIKYGLRWMSKGGLEDLKKARRELDQVIRVMEDAGPSIYPIDDGE